MTPPFALEDLENFGNFPILSHKIYVRSQRCGLGLVPFMDPPPPAYTKTLMG